MGKINRSRQLLTVRLMVLISTVSIGQHVQAQEKMSAIDCQLACPGTDSWPVNERYEPNPQGRYCLVANHNSKTGRYNFSDLGRTNPIADPTAMPFDGQVYVTGTADAFGVANFPIFASSNLTDWRIEQYAFPEGARSGGRIVINGRAFQNLWAPHLYYDPLVNRIFLSFTATECLAGVCDLSWEQQVRYQTVYSTSISVANFRSGGFFADLSEGNGAEPLMYGYTVNNNGGTRYFDGGWQQGRGMKIIPTSGNADLLGCAVGRGCLGPSIWRPGFVYQAGVFMSTVVEKRAWMHLDSFVFFDPQAGNRRYMLYVFEGGPTPLTHGANLAAYPMVDPVNMDANANELLPLANARNDRWGRNGAPNGCDGNASPTHGCVAEGPAVFERNGWYYLLVSRNGTGDSDYMITYRKARSMQELAANSWHDRTSHEDILAISSERGTPGGISFGHGEVIFVPEQGRHYLILHRKDSRPDWWMHRVPFLKELSFDEGSGRIDAPLQDRASQGLRYDLNYFLISRPTCP